MKACRLFSADLFPNADCALFHTTTQYRWLWSLDQWFWPLYTLVLRPYAAPHLLAVQQAFRMSGDGGDGVEVPEDHADMWRMSTTNVIGK